MVFCLSNQLPWLKVQTSKPALWPYPPGIGFQVPGCTCDRGHHVTSLDGPISIKENDSKLTNEDGFFSTSSCMNFDKIIFITYIYIITLMYIYICTFMYGKIKENSDTKFWFVLICVSPSRLLYGVPPHQILLKPSTFSSGLHISYHFFQSQAPGLPCASKELFLALILWKITDSNTTQWSDNEQCGGLGATETSGIQSTHGLGLVVSDLNRGTPKESNPFHFGGFRESKPQGLLETKHTHLRIESDAPSPWKRHVYIILEKISWSCLPPKLITIHESQSLPRWTCQQQKDMAITFVGTLQWWTPQDYQVQKQVSRKKVCFFLKLLTVNVS